MVLVLVLHVSALGRPLSMSAIDELGRHARHCSERRPADHQQAGAQGVGNSAAVQPGVEIRKTNNADAAHHREDGATHDKHPAQNVQQHPHDLTCPSLGSRSGLRA